MGGPGWLLGRWLAVFRLPPGSRGRGERAEGCKPDIDRAASCAIGLQADVTAWAKSHKNVYGSREPIIPLRDLARQVLVQCGVGAQISCWAWVGGSYRCLSGD